MTDCESGLIHLLNEARLPSRKPVVGNIDLARRIMDYFAGQQHGAVLVERDSIAPSQRERAVSPKRALDVQIASDPDYAWSWHCNLAMPLVDWAGLSRAKANDIAASLMQFLFGIDTRLHPHYNVRPEPDEQQRGADDPAELWARIHVLEEEAKGPNGFATWKDAAISERARRVSAEVAAPPAPKDAP